MAFNKKAAQLAIILVIVQVALAKEQSVNGNFCQGCKSTMSFLHRLNGTETRGAFRNVLLQLCRDQYPPSTDYREGPCEYMVAKTLQAIDRMNPATHCDEIGACSPNELPEPRLNEYNDDVVCNICVDTVNQFKDSLSDPKNIDQIRAGFKKLCEYLSKINEDQACNDLLNNYVDQMLQFVQRIDAKSYCTALSLCHRKTGLATTSSLLDRLMLPSLNDFADIGLQLGVKFVEPNIQDMPAMQDTVTTGEVKALPCTLCKTVIKQIIPLINQNRTEATIQEALVKVCQLVYKNDAKRKECDEFVDRYADEIVKILIDESAPELVCMMIELCTYDIPLKTFGPIQNSPTNEINQFKELFTLLDNSLNVTSEVCLECKLFIHFVKNKLSNVKSVEEFKKLLNTKICAHITEEQVATACKKMVDEYSGRIFDAIVRNLNSEEVCEEFDMCKPNRDLESQKGIVMRNENYCDTCTSTVAYIDKLLATQSVDREISHLVDTVCNNFPNANRNECRLIIDTFGPEILRAIGTMNNPNQLCRELGLCHKNKHLLGGVKCSFGPSYWCQSSDHALACRTSDYCKQRFWNRQ